MQSTSAWYSNPRNLLIAIGAASIALAVLVVGLSLALTSSSTESGPSGGSETVLQVAGPRASAAEEQEYLYQLRTSANRAYLEAFSDEGLLTMGYRAVEIYSHHASHGVANINTVLADFMAEYPSLRYGPAAALVTTAQRHLTQEG
jgi:hypothetical protein